MTSGSPPAPGAAATKRVVRTERRRGPYRAGIALQVLGALLAVAGWLVSTAVSSAEILADAGSARLGDAIEFDAEARRYVIVLVRGELDRGDGIDASVAQVDCSITLADGTTSEPTDDPQTVAEQSELGATVATFDAVAGPTVVTCDGLRGIVFDRYAVAPYRVAAKIVAWSLIGVGIVTILVGAVLWYVGVRGRAVVERVPV